MKNYIGLFDSSPFAFDGKNNILEEKDLGICADIASVLTPENSVTALNCFQGCPYTNTSFNINVILNGERVKTASWKWLPSAMLRKGETSDFSVETLTVIVPRQRSLVMKVTVVNRLNSELSMPLSIMYRGRTRLEQDWQFSIPKPSPDNRENYSATDRILSSVADGASYRLTCSLDGMSLFKRAYLWENEITLGALESFTFYISAHMGEESKSLSEAENALDKYESLIEDSFLYFQEESARIEENLPHFSSSDPALTSFYYRSLVSYILCRWENPDLCTSPYYSTGSVTGGCMCSYLWDYCGGLMMHPIYDPEGNKNNIKAYLKNDLTTSYALNPVTSGAVGPWYQINQEKVILMVYHHIRATGDIAFLSEKVEGKTILEWMIFHAYVCDDTSKDVELFDYGVGGNSHLELHNRGNGPYNGIMPDLNARRYMNYMRVYELTLLAGTPDEKLPLRAKALAEKLKALWNDSLGWYDFIDANGNRGVRYTVQMFKFLNSAVIGDKERNALISHLNDREFLSKFGLHSMSKLDDQYDQDDIDNGGGGVCSHFATEICSQLFELGKDELACDILKRLYWWGERMPYMGDSCAANMIANREDTPLQGNIHAISGAQTILFYIFGITPDFNGRVTVSPARVRPTENMTVENVRLCGKNFSVSITADSFTVRYGEKEITEKIGNSIVI